MIKNLFLQSCSEKELKIRDLILFIAQILLWGITALAVLKVIFIYLFDLGSPSLTTWSVALITLFFSFRFELWSMHFKSREYHRCGQDWVVNGIKDNPMFQSKFFLWWKKHHDGEKNPLW